MIILPSVLTVFESTSEFHNLTVKCEIIKALFQIVATSR